jgi:hypothetical protein
VRGPGKESSVGTAGHVGQLGGGWGGGVKVFRSIQRGFFSAFLIQKPFLDDHSFQVYEKNAIEGSDRTLLKTKTELKRDFGRGKSHEHTNNTTEQLTALKHPTSKDNVYLTEEGYHVLSESSQKGNHIRRNHKG